VPTTHHVLAAATTNLAVTIQAAVLTVNSPAELAVALSQRQKPVLIENDELKRKFATLAYLQEARWWLIPILLSWVLCQAIAKNYKIDASWHLNWRIERTFDGKITLTPTALDQSQQAVDRSAD
jgi:hypothetical protein